VRLAQRKTACGPHETECTVFSQGRHRNVLVRLHPHYIELRLKGCRRSVALAYDGLFVLGEKKQLEAERRARREAKKVKAQ
jgi:hypothetical protein